MEEIAGATLGSPKAVTHWHERAIHRIVPTDVGVTG